MTTTSASYPKAVSEFLEDVKLMYINGQWVPSNANNIYESINPATNEVLAVIHEGDAVDVDLAVKSARAAFKTWKKTAAIERAKKLNKLADLIERDANIIAYIETLDYGGTIMGTRYGFVESAIKHIRYYAGYATKLFGKTLEMSSGANVHAYTKREPIGVCGQITSWNFPISGATWKIAAPVAAGNTVVLKPSQQTSLTTLYLAKLIDEVGFPPGVINVVTGKGSKLGEAITSHPDIDKISFTGSTVVGKGIMEKAATDLKKLTLELGGKSPNIIFADADLEQAMPFAVKALFTNQGQVCAAGSRLYVERSVYDQVKEHLIGAISNLKVGDPLDNTTNIGPIVSKEQLNTVMSYVEAAKKDGATILVGGKQPDDPSLSKGNYYLPTLIEGLDENCLAVAEEIFGPVLVMMPFDSLEEIVERANLTEYGLAAAVWTKDINKAHYMIDHLESGQVWVNGYFLVDDNIPLTGFKQSGVGSEMSQEGIEAYTKIKSVVINLG